MAAAAPTSPQPEIRRLKLSDHSKGFTELLAQLTSSPPLSADAFRRRFSELSALGNDHLVAVVEDAASGRVVATGTVLVERKFLRGGGKVAHVEDVVVDTAARGRGLGRAVVGYLVEHARREGCYKVILDCAVDKKGFYEGCGFEERNVQMAMYF